MRVVSFALASLAAATAASPAMAWAQDGDGLYGRFDSAMSVALSAGATLDTRGRFGTTADVRLRVLHTGGLIAAVSYEPGARAHGLFGVELRPLYPSVFLQSMSTGRPALDLLLQSPGIEFGIDTPFERPVPIGIAWGVFLDVPIVRPDQFVHGMSLRLGYRKTTVLEDFRPNTGVAGDVVRKTFLATFCVAFDAGSALASWEPPRHRAR